MMNFDLDSSLLTWMAEDFKGNPVPIKCLIVRMAIIHKESDEDLTQSTEISLNAFDRANLYRVLRNLERKGLVVFVNANGMALSEPERQSITSPDAADKVLGFVKLTDAGHVELKKVKRFQHPTDEEKEETDATP